MVCLFFLTSKYSYFYLLNFNSVVFGNKTLVSLVLKDNQICLKIGMSVHTYRQ